MRVQVKERREKNEVYTYIEAPRWIVDQKLFEEVRYGGYINMEGLGMDLRWCGCDHPQELDKICKNFINLIYIFIKLLYFTPQNLTFFSALNFVP